MVVYCCAFGCKEKFLKGGPYTFHNFPRDEKRKRLWEKQLRRKNFKVSQNTKICSKHFTADCFDAEKFGGTWLKKDAVPTIFDFSVPDHLSKKLDPPEPESVSNPNSEIMPVTEEQKDENVTIEKERADDVPILNKRRLGDFTLEDMFYPYKAKRMFKFAAAKQQVAYANMLNLMGKNKRMRKRVDALQRINRKIKSRARKAAEEESKEVLKNLYYFSEFNLSDMESEKKAKEMFNLAIEKQKQTSLRVKALKLRNKRMDKRLAWLKEKINRKKSFLSEEERKILEEDFIVSIPDNKTPSTLLQVPKKRKIEKLLIALPEPKKIEELNSAAIITPDLPGFSKPSSSSYFKSGSSVSEVLSRTIKQESHDLPDILTIPADKNQKNFLPKSSASSKEKSPFHHMVLQPIIKQEPMDSPDFQSKTSVTNNLSPELLPSNKNSLCSSVVLIKEEPRTEVDL
ncbi:uncharacterized protein [Parasteatoda tepidariorum]|uniref:uncharacterized protein n=1 Tax=Parasteatoda tepidariorum TaxID=114398 RepID=UPI0039BD65E7